MYNDNIYKLLVWTTKNGWWEYQVMTSTSSEVLTGQCKGNLSDMWDMIYEHIEGVNWLKSWQKQK